MNNSDCVASSSIAGRVLDSVRVSSVKYLDESLSVSVSIGLACLQQDENAKDIFNRADEALYAAKNDGRDQVKVA